MSSGAAIPPALVVIGSSNTDLVTQVERLPQPGETALGADLRIAAGGKGANQAVAARRLGADVTFVACLGDDSFGAAAWDILAHEGLRLDYLRRLPGVASGVALIAVAATGENSIVVAAGANARLSAADSARAAPAIRAARIVLAQLETPLAATVHAFTIARAAGVLTLLNPAPARPLDSALLQLTDLLALNEHEAETLTGVAVTTTERAETAARALLARGPRLVLLTRGAAGSSLAEVGADGVTHLPAFTVNVVDTTAAGDAFIGAFATRYASGAPAAEAARYASAAAALSVQTVGAQPSLPTAAAVEAFLRAHD